MGTRKCAWALMGARKGAGLFWAPGRVPGSYGHQEGCLGSYGHQEGCLGFSQISFLWYIYAKASPHTFSFLRPFTVALQRLIAMPFEVGVS